MAKLKDLDGGIPKLNMSASDTSTGGGGGGGGGSGTPNKDLMADARDSLSGNWAMAILGYFLYGLLAASISFFVVVATVFVGAMAGIAGGDIESSANLISMVSNIFQLLISGALMVGFCGYYLGISQEGEARLELLFVGFRRFWKSFGVYFFYSLFIILWMLLFIIPGIIKTYSYAMAFFIIADDEDCGPLEAISRSKEMMKGNKWKYFCLNCRFIGWALLAAFFTFGLGFLWLVPYMQTSMAKFYEDVS